MNQILYTGSKKKEPASIKTIVLFFCISILLFGLVLIGEGSYAMIKDKQKQEEESQKQILAVTVEKEGNQIVIRVKNDKVIDKIIYNWNNTQDIILLGKGRTEIEERIELPVGNNILNIKVIDIAAREKTYQKQYMLQEGDSTIPEIELVLNGNDVKIVARDDEQLSYITYRWNEEEETRIDAREESPKLIETQLPLKKGKNKLVVVAVDANNNSGNKEQEFEGITKAKLELGKEGNYLLIKATDEDDGIDRVEYTINGSNYTLVLGEGMDDKMLEYKQELQSGENPFTIKVYNKHGDLTTQSGICPN